MRDGRGLLRLVGRRRGEGVWIIDVFGVVKKDLMLGVGSEI